MTKVNPNNGNETTSDIFPWDISKSDTRYQWLSKLNFLSFMVKVNPSSGNETKSDIFSWDIFK